MTTEDPEERRELVGIGVSPGFACGEVFLHSSGFPKHNLETVSQEKIPEEINKLTEAFRLTCREMEEIRSHASASDSVEMTGILDAQILILNDEDFLRQIKEKITASGYSALYAFSSTVNENIERLERSRQPYIREMAADIETVSIHVLKFLLGKKHRKLAGFQFPAILFGSYFNPGEILEMPHLNVVGFVTEKGGQASHMSLFAKSLGIPAVVGVKANLKQTAIGGRAIVDGSSGRVIINPNQKEWDECRKQAQEALEKRYQKLERVSRIPSLTKDAHPVEIAANLDLPTSLDDILAKEKVGVGLYRTEFLYLQNASFPSEEEQAEAYIKIAKKFAPQSVILRTFDLGGDKLTEHFKSNDENNPALGWRAIRFSLDVPRIFESQLRAMLRASACKNIKIMLPLISTLEEVRAAQAILKTAREDLEKERVRFDKEIQLGIMIETPAAVQIADFLAREVDFFSIGTNDLTQYTLAVDRNNARVAKLFQAFHPAIILSIKKTVEAAHKAGIPVGVCGEMAGDPLATKLLIGLGIDSLSMNPASIPVVKRILPMIEFEEALKFAQKILEFPTELEVNEALLKDYRQYFLN